MEQLQKVKAIQEDGDWFVIPEESEYYFSALVDKMEKTNYEDQEVIDEFEGYFGRYKTGGDLNLITLYAEL